MPPTTTQTPNNARDLLAALRPYDPTVEGDELAFDADPPESLAPILRLLHTGVRAQLAGKKWFGLQGGKMAVVLNPAAPIPEGITLLAVEGDTVWDRILHR